ncbi:MAG: HD domain-containing protein [Planctomycetota bacterium]|nr:HD domain-containing protein [Planctomycetota bacterium]
MMARRFVSELAHQEPVDQVFLASQKQLRPNRNGNLYLQVELSDRTGAIRSYMWNADEGDYRGFEDGDFVRVEGNAQLYQGAMQLIISNICKAREDEIDYTDYACLTPADIDRMARRVAELLRGMKDPALLNLAECFISDDELMQRFTRAPAGVKNHHAYPGGLLQHILSLMELTTLIADHYPALDAELLLMGAFLHDLGKVDELTSDRGLAYTDAGQLIGHTVLAVGILHEKLRQVEELSGEPVPTETVLRLQHMIVSHHGEYAYGAPKLPMTLEAIALHHLDNLDAKLHNFEQLMRDDANVDSAWTQYHPNLNRKLFKGTKASEVAK